MVSEQGMGGEVMERRGGRGEEGEERRERRRWGGEEGEERRIEDLDGLLTRSLWECRARQTASVWQPL